MAEKEIQFNSEEALDFSGYQTPTERAVFMHRDGSGRTMAGPNQDRSCSSAAEDSALSPARGEVRKYRIIKREQRKKAAGENTDNDRGFTESPKSLRCDGEGLKAKELGEE